MRIALLCLALVACSKKSENTDKGEPAASSASASTCDGVPAKLAPFTIAGQMKNTKFSVLQVPFEQTDPKTTFELVFHPGQPPWNTNADPSDRSWGNLSDRIRPGRYEVIPIKPDLDRPFETRIFDWGTKIRMDAVAGTLVIDEVTPNAIKAHYENLVLQDYIESESKLVPDGCRATAERVTLAIELI